MTKHKIYTMSFASVYLHYITKAEKKGRTKAEVDTIISWLTGYSQEELDAIVDAKTDFETFFAESPQLNPARGHITGVICGIRIEDIEEPLMREIRYLDKLIDELAKGKMMEKILREEFPVNPVDEYLDKQPKEIRPIFDKIRELILTNASGAQEIISYGMPGYKLNGKPLVYFAAHKKHLGFYATPTGHEQFADKLSSYKQGKGSVQFPYNKPIPYDLIEEIVKFRVLENLG